MATPTCDAIVELTSRGQAPGAAPVGESCAYSARRAAALLRLPPPAGLAVRAAGATSKAAVTVVAARRVTVQGPMPVHPPPLQPAKTWPAPGFGTSVTAVLAG